MLSALGDDPMRVRRCSVFAVLGDDDDSMRVPASLAVPF
jgi:hypothetical protein